MKISKQLNNNIVIAFDDQGREVVLMGKGIGFGCKPGAEPNMVLVEKQFFGLSSGTHIQQLAERGVDALLRSILRRSPSVHGLVPFHLVEGESAAPLN